MKAIGRLASGREQNSTQFSWRKTLETHDYSCRWGRVGVGGGLLSPMGLNDAHERVRLRPHSGFFSRFICRLEKSQIISVILKTNDSGDNVTPPSCKNATFWSQAKADDGAVSISCSGHTDCLRGAISCQGLDFAIFPLMTIIITIHRSGSKLVVFFFFFLPFFFF